MSISGKTMNVEKLTVGGKDVKTVLTDLMTKRTLGFTFPEMGIKSLLTLDFQGCEFSFIENSFYDIVILDAENKFVCGKFR